MLGIELPGLVHKVAPKAVTLAGIELAGRQQDVVGLATFSRPATRARKTAPTT